MPDGPYRRTSNRLRTRKRWPAPFKMKPAASDGDWRFRQQPSLPQGNWTWHRPQSNISCGICHHAAVWRCHRDLKDCRKLLTIKRADILAARSEVSGVIERGFAAVRSGAACIICDAEVDGETAKYTNSPATIGGKGVSHSVQSGAVGGASFCNSATWRAPQLGLWHWIKVLRTIVLPRACALRNLRSGLAGSVNRHWELAGPATKLSFPPVAIWQQPQLIRNWTHQLRRPRYFHC